MCMACAGLTCTLRGYQRRALAWMAHREACLGDEQSEAGPSAAAAALPECFADARSIWNGTQHPCWQRIALPSGLHIYHNWNAGERAGRATGLHPSQGLLVIYCVRGGWSSSLFKQCRYRKAAASHHRFTLPGAMQARCRASRRCRRSA